MIAGGCPLRGRAHHLLDYWSGLGTDVQYWCGLVIPRMDFRPAACAGSVAPAQAVDLDDRPGPLRRRSSRSATWWWRTCSGEFDGPTGTVTFDPAGLARTLKVDAAFETKSVNTRNADRDKDLRSDLFFDVGKYPEDDVQVEARRSRSGPAG